MDLFQYDFSDVSLACQSFVVMSTSNNELITHLILITDVFLISILGDNILLNVNGLVQEFKTVIILIFFQVNASQVIHATT
jgi:hypothetical protein